MICFGLKLIKMAESLEVEKAQIPRKRKLPKRHDDGLAEAELHDDPKSYYRQRYFEAIDLSINCIRSNLSNWGIKFIVILNNCF